MEITHARQVVRHFVSGWTTQKLCEVLAFAEDRKMDAMNICQCLLGVASSDQLHASKDCPKPYHFTLYRDDYNARNAELAYFALDGTGGRLVGYNAAQWRIDHEFTTILRQVLAEREALNSAIHEPEEFAVSGNGASING